jgi:hypothetical protein
MIQTTMIARENSADKFEFQVLPRQNKFEFQVLPRQNNFPVDSFAKAERVNTL